MDIWTKMMSYTTIIICKMKRTTKNIQHNLHTTLNDIPFSHLFLCYNQRQWPVVHFRLGTDLISRCTLPATPSAQKPIVLMSWWHITEKSKNHSILDVYYKALKQWEKYRTIVYINKSSYIYITILVRLYLSVLSWGLIKTFFKAKGFFLKMGGFGPSV